MKLDQKDQPGHRISSSKGGMNPSGLDVVATDSLLAAADQPVKITTTGDVGDQGDALEVYDDVDIRSPRADHT